MQTVSISFFRFGGLGARLWAFGQMQFAHRAMRRLPCTFYKLMGTGTGEGFDPVPNTGVYAILAVWTDAELAQGQVAGARIFERYRAHATESWTIFLSATSSRGEWATAAPFEPSDALAPGPLAVLTRASVKPRHVRSFWKQVPGVSASLDMQERPVFQIGMGEIPWLHQVTFSVWRDIAQMRAFAYDCPFHREAIRSVRRDDWFNEELYARFVVTGAQGQWNGTPPAVSAMLGEN